MDNNNAFSFFSYPFIAVKSPEEALTRLKNIPMYARVVFIQDSAHHVLPALRSEIERRDGDYLKFRTSGPWNKFFKLVSDIENIRDTTDIPFYADASDVWFISLIPAEEVCSAMKRQRVVNKLTNREEFFLKTLPYGVEHDDIILLTLNDQMCYLTDREYKSLTIKEVFDLSSFEGCRFLKPVHDAQTCSVIMNRRAA